MLKSQDFNAGIGAAQMLGKANFIALVGGGRQPKFAQNKVSGLGKADGAVLTRCVGDYMGRCKAEDFHPNSCHHNGSRSALVENAHRGCATE